MTEAADAFAQVAPGVLSAESISEGECIHVYRGELDEPGVGQVRILTLTPDISDEAVSDAFKRVAGQWHNPSTHPNVVTVHKRDDTPRPWLAVADIDAQLLSDVRSDLSLAEIQKVIADVAEAIRNAGLYDTAHTALSPEDIWVVRSDDGVAGIVDNWGLERACRVAAGENPLSPFTAPELVETPDAETEQIDIYGLGALAYYALTGHPPVSDDGDLETALRSGDVTPPSELNPAVTEAVDEVVLQALSRSPTTRHRSVHDFKTAFTSGLPTQDEIDTSATDLIEEQTPSAPQREEEHSEPDEKKTEETKAEPSRSSSRREKARASDSQERDDTQTDTSSIVTRRRALAVLGVAGIGAASWFTSQSGSNNIKTSEGIPDTPTPDTSTPDTPTPDTPTPDTPTPDTPTPDTPEEVPDPPVPDGPEDVNESEIGDWAGFRYNLANTGTTAGSSGPETYLIEEWTFKTNRKVFSSPAMVDGTVYVGSNDGYVYALDAADGTEKWAFETGNSVRSSPAVVDGNVYVGSDDWSLYALDAADGSMKWSFQTARSVFSSPAVVEGTVYVGSDDGAVYALDAAEGTEEWTFETGDGVRSSPAVVDGTVYVGSDDGSVYAVNAADGSEEWAFDAGGRVQSSPTVVDETVYVGDDLSNLYALGIIRGKEQWTFQTDGRIFSSPAVVNNTVFVGSRNQMHAVDRFTGSKEWSFEMNGRVMSSPAVVDGTVYVGSNQSATTAEENTVFGIDARDGTRVTAFETAANVQSSPAIGDNIIYIGCDDANVYALTEGY